MSSEGTSRRRLLQGAGIALLSSLAGCGTTGSARSETTTDAGTTTDSPTTTRTATAESEDEEPSPYTRVYEETIGSVVLIRVSADGGGGQGSGFVYRDDYLVTNAHVGGDVSEVQVRFSEGEWRSASVVGTDPSSDLAVVQVTDRPSYATALPLVDDQPPIGEEVVAIGNPYGLEGTVTSGIISGLNRSIPAPNGYTIPDAVQTGAPVNPGNSGGPLVTLEGEAVGVINSGGGDNLAFAISAALVRRVVPALVENGEYDHAYMGVGLRTVTPAVADQVGLAEPRGVLVTDVLAGGPSADVLRSGDVVLRIEDRRVDSRQQLASYLALEASPGDTVRLTVRRDGDRRTAELTLGERPERPATAR